MTFGITDYPSLGFREDMVGVGPNAMATTSWAESFGSLSRLMRELGSDKEGGGGGGGKENGEKKIKTEGDGATQDESAEGEFNTHHHHTHTHTPPPPHTHTHTPPPPHTHTTTTTHTHTTTTTHTHHHHHTHTRTPPAAAVFPLVRFLEVLQDYAMHLCLTAGRTDGTTPQGHTHLMGHPANRSSGGAGESSDSCRLYHSHSVISAILSGRQLVANSAAGAKKMVTPLSATRPAQVELSKQENSGEPSSGSHDCHMTVT